MFSQPTIDEWLQFAKSCKAPELRDFVKFATEEIILPDGPQQGLLFRLDRQPWAAFWLSACSDENWRRLALVGPTQSGKTLTGYVIPLMWHLFEQGETVVCGIPDMVMAGDKYREDIKPAIDASGYRALLPDKGAGSRDAAKVESVTFKNRRTMKFMSGGGKDQKRAGFTTRVVLVTEADGLDEAGTSSREASKLKQIEGRTKAYGEQSRIYLECTASIQGGAIWQAWKNGSGSMIAVECPSCGFYVIPERDALVGWQEAATVIEARNSAAWKCPHCASVWQEENRAQMNQSGKLVHGIAQQWTDDDDKPWNHVKAIHPNEIDDWCTRQEGQTEFSMRYNAFNNLFVTARQLAEAEWKATRAMDADDADKQIRQQNWAMPARKTSEHVVDIAIDSIVKRQHDTPRGIVPDECTHLTAYMDMGKHRCHWMVMGWTNEFRGYVIDYGVKEVAQSMSLERALQIAIQEQWDEFQTGYRGEKRPDLLLVNRMMVDAGWMPEPIYETCCEIGLKRVMPSKGYGQSREFKAGSYSKPKAATKEVTPMLEYHLAVVTFDKGKVVLVHINADYWKTFAHHRLGCPVDDPMAVTLYSTEEMKHLELARHLTAEEMKTEFDPKKGEVAYWERVRRDNHWLDCYAGNCVVAHSLGTRFKNSVKGD